jgi:hypothetical protein
VYLNCIRKCSYLLLLIFILIPLNLYAGGQKEDKLPQALELVEQRRYNDAILILTEIMKTNPDQFVEAQKLIQKISIARDSYNNLYEQLIGILDPPPGETIDEDMAYGIIKEMEALDREPNKAAVEAFAQAKNSIIFAVDNRAYENIMNMAADQIINKEYTGAIETYLTGFNLHKENFLDNEYGNIVEDQVSIYQDLVFSNSRDFLNFYNVFLEKTENYSNIILNADISEIENGYLDYSSVMLEAGKTWRILKSTAGKLDSLRLSAQREDESDIPYISLNRVLSVGRSNSETEEGIAGIISILWDEEQNNISRDLIFNLENLYTGAVSNYEKSSFQEAQTQFPDASRMAGVVIDVLKLRGDKLYLNNNLDINDNGLAQINRELPYFKFAQTLPEFIDTYIDLTVHSENINSLVKTIDAAGIVDDIKKARLNLDDIHIELSEMETSIADNDNLSTNLELDLSLLKDAFTTLEDNIRLLEEKLFVAKVRAEERILTLKIRPEKLVIENSTESILTAGNFIDGIEDVINGLVLQVKRPDSAVQLLTKTQTDLEKADLELENIIESLDNKNPLEKADKSLVILLEAASKLRTDIVEKTNKITRLLSRAKVLNDSADDAYSLGNLRLDEAYSKFSREDYDGARKKYYDAESQFLKSLEYRENESVRNLLTTELAKLDSDITDALNSQIVREVRALITRGKDFYNLQEFIKAEQSFQQAQERYKVTNTARNSEIENWLIKIKRALEATSGREIALTDPLYPDIISILNLVQEEFEKGKNFLNSGSKDQADIHFTEAIKKIELVKTPFPRNFKASVLYLQILEYTQAEAFKSFFKSMYDTSIKNISNDPKTADDDLLALYEINPDYPGIKSSINKSGIAAGRIIPPPAQVDIKRATELYNKARVIVNSDNRAQYPIALAYLEEAIQVNSDFDAAAVLMDRIRTSTGAVSQVEMTTSDTQQLRYAESLYIEGRYLEANIIINQLWLNPENRKSSKLDDLKAKVEARL